MDIRVVDDASRDSAVGAAIQNLVRTQLANEQSLEATLRQIGFGSGNALLIGGFVDGELATMNAFMPQDFVKGNDRIVGFQSGFSATGGEHRGKGYWPKLLTAGMDLLRAKGGHFVYGFPNSVSHPLFEKKLAFTTTQMWRVVLPTFATHVVSLRSRSADGQYRPDLHQAAALKRKGDDELLQVGEKACFAFGKVRSAKGLRFVDIGGLASNNGDLNRPVRLLCKAARASLFRFEASQSSEFEQGFRPRQVSRPVIFKALGTSIDIRDVSFVGGLADNF